MTISRIVIIHCQHDSGLCHSIARSLRVVKYQVWYDPWVSIREYIPKYISRGIRARYALPEGDVYLLLISKSAQASVPWQQRKREALARNHVLLPLLCEPTDVEGFLHLRHFLRVVGLDEGHVVRQVIAELELITADASTQPQVHQVHRAPQSRRTKYFSALLIVFILLFTFTASAGDIKAKSQANKSAGASIVYFGSVDRNIYALNETDGMLLWKHWIGGSTGSLDVVLANEIVYVSTGSDGLVYALSARSGKEIWRYHFSDEVDHVVVGNGNIYVASSNIFKMISEGPGFICALQAERGKPIWCQKIIDGVPVTSLLVTNGVIYALTFLGNLYALQSSDGHIVWSHKLGGSSHGINIAADKVYTTVGNQLCVWQARDGSNLWCYQARGEVVTAPFFYQSNVYFGADDGSVHVFTSTGKPLWHYLVQSGNTPTGFAIADDVICVLVSDKNNNNIGYVYGLTERKGELIWSYKIDGGVDVSTISNHIIYIGASSGVYAITLQTGALVWFYSNIARSLSPDLLISNSAIYFGCFDNYLYALSIHGQLRWRYLTGGSVGPSIVNSKL